MLYFGLCVPVGIHCGLVRGDMRVLFIVAYVFLSIRQATVNRKEILCLKKEIASLAYS